MIEFTLHEVLTASISQVMATSNGKHIRIVNDTAEDVLGETLYGDCVRLQQVLADFLLIAVNFTPNGGQLVVLANLAKDQLGQSVHLAHLELRFCFVSFICIHGFILIVDLRPKYTSKMRMFPAHQFKHLVSFFV